MPAPVSASFSAAQNSTTREPRSKMLLIFRDQAESAEGSVATSDGDFSADFPPAGAINGDKTHINYGPAATADNGIGKSGWKSGSALASITKTGASDWNAGVQVRAKTIGHEVQVAFAYITSAFYSQNFDGLALGDLAGQDGWASGAGLAEVENTVVIAGTQSLAMKRTGAGFTYSRAWNPGQNYTHEWLYRWNGVAALHEVTIFYGAGTIRATTQSTGTLSLTHASGTLHNLGTFIAGTDYKLRFEVRTGSVSLFLDDVLVATGTAPAGNPLALNLTAGAFGTDTLAYYDNFISQTLTSTSVYEQDFNGLAIATLIGQDSWTSVSGTSPVDVAAGAGAGMDGNAIRMTSATALTRRVRRALGSTASRVLFFESNRTIQGSGGAGSTFRIILRDGGAGVDRYELRWNAVGTNSVTFAGTAAASVANDLNATQGIGVVERFAVAWSSGGVGATVDVYVNGRQVDRQIVDMTGINTIDLEEVRGAGATDPVMWIDNIRMGQLLDDIGTQENVADFGVIPVSGDALLGFMDDSSVPSIFIDGAFYGLDMNDGTRVLRRSTAPIGLLLAQTFEATSLSQLDAAGVQIFRTATSPVGNIWLELRSTSAGVPTTAILARSQSVPASSLGTSTTPEATVFSFPAPAMLQATTRYALVLAGDYVQSNTINVGLRVDTIAPGYATGQVYDTADGTTWNAQAEDAGFVCLQTQQIETFYGAVNQDSNGLLGESNLNYLLSQGFKVPYDVDSRHARVLLKVPAGAAFAAGDRFWAEYQSDSTAFPGQPNNLPLAQSIQYPCSAVGVAGGAYVEFTCSMAVPVRLLAGVQYHLVLKTNKNPDTVNFLHVGYDASSPSYPNGSMNRGINIVLPVTDYLWFPVAGDMVFSVLATFRPWLRFDVAWSDDNLTYTAFQKITDNPGRVPVLANIPIAGLPKRYWKMRASLIRKTTDGFSRPLNKPRLHNWTLTIPFATEKNLTVAFGQSRNINRIELFAHPTEGGCRRFRLLGSTDGILFTDLTDVDIDTMESKRKGGGASISYASPIFTTTGDAIAVNFQSLHAITHIRIKVLGNIDQWARIIEIGAFRMEDAYARILSDQGQVGNFQDSQDADFVLRRINARVLQLTLNNQDRALSTENAASPLYGQTGEGVRIIPWVGFQNVTDLVKIGEFFVDDWNEDMGVDIQINARDGVKQMSTTVRANFKTGLRHFEIIEYLANLTNIPSTNMILDRTAGIVDYFAPNELDAYQEAQRVREGAGIAKLFFDRNGDLNFRAVGHTTGNTDLEDLLGTFLNPRAVGCGRAAQLGDVIYQTVFTPNPTSSYAGGAQLNLLSYNSLTGGPWVNLGQVALGPFPGGATLFTFDGSLFLVYQPSAGSGTDTRLLRWTGTGATFTLIATYVMDFGDLFLERPPIVQVAGAYAYFVNTISNANPRLNILNLLTFQAFNLGGNVDVGAECKGIGYENGRVLTLNRAGGGNLKLSELDPYALTVTTRVDFGEPMTPTGLATTGNGYVYAGRQGTLGSQSTTTRLYKVIVPYVGAVGFPFTLTIAGEIPIPSGAANVTPILECVDAVIYRNGAVLGCINQISNARTSARILLFREGETMVDASPMSVGSARLGYLINATVAGKAYIYGVADMARMFELAVGVQETNTSAPVFTISNDTGGAFLGASLNSGADRGGQSQIINGAVIKSQPLLDFAPQLVWSAPDLPAPVAKDTEWSFDVELSDPCIPDATMTASITTSPAASATVSFKTKRSQQPTMVVTVTAECSVTALSVTGRPLRSAAGLISIVIGPRVSRNQYGPRDFRMENDYIYDPFMQSVLASDIVLRNWRRRPNIKGVKSRAFWDMEILDTVAIKETESLKIDGNFAVIRFSRNYLNQTMTVEVRGL